MAGPFTHWLVPRMAGQLVFDHLHLGCDATCEPPVHESIAYVGADGGEYTAEDLFALWHERCKPFVTVLAFIETPEFVPPPVTGIGTIDGMDWDEPGIRSFVIRWQLEGRMNGQLRTPDVPQAFRD